MALLLSLFENEMKPHKYIASLFIASLLFVGATELLAHPQSKSQVGSAMVLAQEIDFSSYVSGQILHLDFDATLNSNYSIELYNLTGAKVGSWKIEKNSNEKCEVTLDQPLRKGMYIIKVSAGEKVVAKKLQT